MSAQITEETVIRNRRVFDSRLIKKCRKSFMSLAVGDHTNEESIQTSLTNFLTDVTNLSTQFRKHHFIQLTTHQDDALFNSLRHTLTAQIQEAQADIERLKHELECAKIRKKNKMEYDATAKIVMKYPARSETEEEIKKTLEDINHLTTERSIIESSKLRRVQAVSNVVSALTSAKDLAAESSALQDGGSDTDSGDAGDADTSHAAREDDMEDGEDDSDDRLRSHRARRDEPATNRSSSPDGAPEERESTDADTAQANQPSDQDGGSANPDSQQAEQSKANSAKNIDIVIKNDDDDEDEEGAITDDIVTEDGALTDDGPLSRASPKNDPMALDP